VRSVFLRILGFVIVIDLFYMGIGRLYLSQSEEHPPEELEITTETDRDTLIEMGATLVDGKGGCLLCHKITEVGNTRGPDLRGVGGRAESRVPGMSAELYLTESLVDPGAYVVEEFATAGGDSIMPAADRPPADLSPTELKAMVGYLQSLGGEVTVTVTAEDVAGAEARKADKPAPTSTHPGFALLTSQGCTACHDINAETRRIGPPLTSVALRLSAAEIRQSIVDPDAVIAEGYQQGLMLQTFSDTLSEEQLDQIVGYLSGEVSMGERLSHPGVHLFLFIVFFNGLVWVLRKVQSAAEASEDGDAGQFELPWRPVGSAVGLVAVFVVVYAGLSTRTPESTTAATPAAAPAEPTRAAGPPDGKALYGATCTACHGPAGKGVPGLGKDMTDSAFVDGLSDSELADFIEEGRTVEDPLNTTGVAMPPNGLNTTLTDEDRLAIARFIRSLGN